jgi:hypothetical protein
MPLAAARSLSPRAASTSTRRGRRTALASPSSRRGGRHAGDELVVIGADGANREQLTASRFFNVETAPVWAPGGRQLALVVLDHTLPQVGSAVYLVDEFGGGLLRLTGVRNVQPRAFAAASRRADHAEPTGPQSVAFFHEPGRGFGLYIWERNDRAPRRLTG